MCRAIIQSGPNKGCQCKNKSKTVDGFCGLHKKFSILANKKKLSIINNSGILITVQKLNHLHTDNNNMEVYDNICQIPNAFMLPIIIANDYSDLTDYNLVYNMSPPISKRLSQNDLLNIEETLIINAPSINNILYKKWKDVALKAMRIPGEIKKLSSNDTVCEMCELVDYIDLPETVTERDYQLAGATYNPDDDEVYVEESDNEDELQEIVTELSPFEEDEVESICDDDDIITERCQEEFHIYYNGWEHLSNEDKQAAYCLGWTEELWSKDVYEEAPDSYNKLWWNLTDDEKEGAIFLGHTPEAWNLGNAFRIPIEDE